MHLDFQYGALKHILVAINLYTLIKIVMQVEEHMLVPTQVAVSTIKLKFI